MPSSNGLWHWRLTASLLVLTVLALAAWTRLLPGAPLRFGHGPDLIAFVVFAAALSGVVALSILAVRRMGREVAARIAADRAASQAHRLAQTTAALGQVRRSADAIEAAVQEGLHWLGGDAGILFLPSEDARHITVARAVGCPLHAGHSWDLGAFGERSPLAESMRRLVPVVVRRSDDWQQEYAEWWAQGPWREDETSLVLPLVVDRRVVAFLQIGFAAPRELTVDDHEYIHMLCSRAAQALSRTWRHEAVERARVDAESLKARVDAELLERQRTEHALRASETRYRALATRTTRLHALTASLSVAASVTAVVQAIVEQAPMVVGANESGLMLTGEQQFEPGTCSAEALNNRRPVFVGSMAESQEKYWRSASAAADKGFASTAALPLVANHAPLGVLEFHFSAPVNFDDEYQALLVSVAQHCAQALDRARLYEEAQRARADAEAANRLKDDFVSTVSHELRTPLNAILGWASMLRTREIDPGVVPQAVDSIHRNASRQAKLVDDLLDFSRIANGRMTLDLEAVDAPALVRGIVESVVPLAAGSQIEIQLSPLPPATLHGDVRRLEQVFVNLLGNALKFTPAGGHIIVSGRIAGRFLEIRVADDGIGIAPEFLPHVFERFRQFDSTPTRHHAGLGLGLSIAKQLVDAHGGSIRAESAGQGKGTSFVVALPLEPRAAETARGTSPAADAPSFNSLRVPAGLRSGAQLSHAPENQ